MPSVDVVIPVYNEEHDLPRSIPTLRDFLKSDAFPYEWRIVIADNASTDSTPEVGSRLQEENPAEVVYVRIERKGRGYALKRTWSESAADVMSYMDVDLSTGISAFPALVRAIAEDGYGVATGTRLHRRSKVERSLQRTVLSRGYNTIIKAAFWTKFSDAQCGFKAISREVAQRVLPMVEDNNWFFDTELLILAEKMGYRIKDIPVEWREDPGTTVKIGSTIAEDLRGLWRMRTTRPWQSAHPEASEE
jgi:glycosyltransferase involved in cell wall biosynthesis